METLPPVPEVSVTFQDKRTVWPPPIVTLDGFALNEFIAGEGQLFAVTVACAEDAAPQPDVAFRVYVVVDCGCAMSTKPFGLPNVPIPGIDTVTPVPDGSVIDQARRTVAFPPIQTAFGVAVKDAIPGAGHAVAVTVLCALAELPHPLLAIRV